MGLSDDMTRAVDAFYAAATGQGDWHEALDLLLRATGYTHASVYASNRLVRQAATDSFRLPIAGTWHNHDPATQAAYEAEYYKHEVSRHYRLAYPDARIIHDLLYDDDRTLDRNAFYAWAERVAGLRYFLLGQTDPDAPVGAVVSLHRPRRAGPTGADEIARFQPLLDHLQRAVLLEHHMAGMMAFGYGSLDLLDGNPTGVVMLDGMGHVVFANRAAREIAATGDALALRGDGIEALREPDNARLQELIAAAVATAAGAWRTARGSLRLARRSGRRGYVVTVTPVSRRESILSNLMPAACLLITDPEAELAPGAEMLREAYGLTAMETRLVQRLMAGDSPAAAAAALGIQATTARSHLSAVFRKTETRRQQDLVRLVASLPWWVT